VYKNCFKRIIDIIVTFLGLPILVLVVIFVAPCIYLEDRGSILYNARRLGKNGVLFTMYKFRTMKVNAPDLRNNDGSTYNGDDDPRLTKIGRFLRKSSLDEAPQLLNVLKGEMSVIGPRPDLPEHIKQYTGNEARKLEIRPGITGYNQAYYRNTLPWKERICMDIYYIDHISMWFDIKIFFRTAVNVLKRRNINIMQENPDVEET